MVKCMLDGAFVALGGPHNLKADYYHSSRTLDITEEEEVDEVGRKCKVVDDLLDEYGIPRLKILYIPSLDWTHRSDQLIQDVIDRYLKALHEDYNDYNWYGPKVLCVVQDPDYWPGSELEDPLVLQRRAAKEKEYNDNPYSKCKPDYKKVSLHHLFGSHYRAKFLVRGQPSFTRHGKKPYGYSAFISYGQDPSKIRSNPQKLFKEKSYWEEEERKMKVEEESEWEEDDWGIKVKETSEEVRKRLAERTWEEIQEEEDRKWKEEEEEEDRKWLEMEKMLGERTLEEIEEEEEDEEEVEEREMKVEEEDDWGIKVKETSEEVRKRLAERTWEEIQEEEDRKWKEEEEEDRKCEEMEKMLAKRTLEESRKMKVDKQIPSAQPSSSKRSRPDSAEYFFFGSPIPKRSRFRYFIPRWARVDEREKKPCLISQPCGGEKEERTSKCTTISPQEKN